MPTVGGKLHVEVPRTNRVYCGVAAVFQAVAHVVYASVHAESHQEDQAEGEAGLLKSRGRHHPQ